MMTADGWVDLIMQAVKRRAAGDDTSLTLLSLHLAMCDEAKQSLRDLGYGWTGLDIAETIKLVPPARS